MDNLLERGNTRASDSKLTSKRKTECTTKAFHPHYVQDCHKGIDNW